MANTVQKLRALFEVNNKPLTITEIKQLSGELKPSEISMGLCYLKRQRYVYRTLVPNSTHGRKNVYQYHYSKTKLPENFADQLDAVV